MSETSVLSTKGCPVPFTCCGKNKLLVLDHDDATGFQYFRMGNGALIMSNIFLSTAFITLGQRSLGCKDDDEICDGEVFGFKPGSLITLVATVTGLMAAFLLPLIGAVVDYTNHRKKLGAIFAIVSLLIQAAQVFTYEANWFFMLILQAVNGFNYQALAVAAYAYLQEIKRDVGEEKLVNYASRYYVCMFGIEATFLVIVIGAALAISADDVLTAQMSQGVNVIVSGGFYYLAFHFFSKKDSVRKLPDGENLVCAAFKSVFVTARGVVKHYPSTLTWFLLAVVFGQAAIGAFTTIAVTFLNENLGFTSVETGLIFLLVLISTLPGAMFAGIITKKTSPLGSIKIASIAFIIVNFVAFYLMADPAYKVVAWPAGATWGFMLGWYYATESVIYASLMPKGQEAELAGFYLYCGQVLAWLPPLVFTAFNENPNINLAWGGIQLNVYIIISLVLYLQMPKWDECVEITQAENKIVSAAADDEGADDLSEDVEITQTKNKIVYNAAADNDDLS